jgi:hypothetical protein
MTLSSRRWIVVVSLLLLLPSFGVAQHVVFEDMASEAGVTALGRGRGVAFGDYDADGDDDLLVCRVDRSVALFQNRGDGTFTDVTISAGLTYIGTPLAAVWGDFDNDGWPDLYIGNIGRNQFFRNQGDGTFVEMTAETGTGDFRDAMAVAAADVDNDGWLDLYVANFQQGNVLFMNNGDGTFRDATDEAGAGHRGLAMGIEFCDYDNDGDQDLLLSHDGSEGNVLLQNDGQGKFRNATREANVSYAPQAMGVDFGDYDRDGDFDLYITLLGDNVLYRNRGDGTFELVQDAQTNDAGMGWGLLWFDFDNDGWLDLYVANESGYSSPAYANVLYHNHGDGSFEKVPDGAGTASLAGSYGCATADVNLDGFIDLYVTNSQTPNHLYINQGENQHWLQVRLEGVQSNRSAVGARLRVVAGGGMQISEVKAGGGYVSQNSFTQHFGLGPATRVDTLEIRWPSGIVEYYTDLPADQRLWIREGVGVVTRVATRNAEVPAEHALFANYPNPFSTGLATASVKGSQVQAEGRFLTSFGSGTRIPFAVGGSQPAQVRVEIFDLLGRPVRLLTETLYAPGRYEVAWDGRNDRGAVVNAGIYFVRMTADGFSARRSLVFLK